jgi:ribosomal-protein-alanine N-acetyltransferase
MLTLPVLTTPRLVLRVPSAGDAEALAAFVLRNREHLRPFEPTRPDSWFTPQFWVKELPALSSRVLREELVAFILVSRFGATPTIVGCCSLTDIVRGPFQAAYLGFGLDHAHVGQGFMTEALQSVLGFAFGSLELHRVMANHVPRNERSARLLERLGFEREGFAKAYLHLDGRWQDHVLTALTSDRWGAGAA